MYSIICVLEIKIILFPTCVLLGLNKDYITKVVNDAYKPQCSQTCQFLVVGQHCELLKLVFISKPTQMGKLYYRLNLVVVNERLSNHRTRAITVSLIYILVTDVHV